MTQRVRLSVVAILLLLLALVLALLVTRCARVEAPARVSSAAPRSAGEHLAAAPRRSAPDEVLTPATLAAPADVAAGAAVRVEWTGPDNRGDYVTIVRADAPATGVGNHAETARGKPLEIPAPLEPGDWEIRYVSGPSRAVLGRAALRVRPIEAALHAPAEVVLGAPLTVEWTGPANAGDYLTLVPQTAPDGRYRDQAPAAKGSPATLTAPVEAGDAEIRYMTGQGNRVLARRTVRVLAPEIVLDAPAQAVAGAVVSVQWRGPGHAGDYITIVPAAMPDGRYLGYADLAGTSPVSVTAPIDTGDAEIRYVARERSTVLARRPIRIVPARIELAGPDEAVAGAVVEITWSGPRNRGDYLTLVPAATPDGHYGYYADTTRGSPLKITAPMTVGAAELRYMSGQGARVLARRPMRIAAPEITLSGPRNAVAGESVDVAWTGPNNPGDYLTIVPRGAKDGESAHYADTQGRSPTRVRVPNQPGPWELRYMSGQENVVLARAAVEIR